MSYIRDRAIVLRAEPFREQDVWLVCYGRSLGKFTSVARGSRVLKAKHLGHLQALSEVEVMVAKGAAFDKMAVARLVTVRHHVKNSLSATVLAGAAADFVDKLTQPGSPDPYIYELLQEALDVFFDTENEVTPIRGQFLFAAFALKVLRMLGYVPDVRHCNACRKPLKEDAFLLSKLGIVTCADCRYGQFRAEEAERLPARAIPLFSFVSSQPLQDCLKVTAPQELLETVQAMVMASLRQTPVRAAPHGFTSVAMLLASV